MINTNDDVTNVFLNEIPPSKRSKSSTPCDPDDVSEKISILSQKLSDVKKERENSDISFSAKIADIKNDLSKLKTIFPNSSSGEISCKDGETKSLIRILGPNGILIYEGECQNGKPHGMGKYFHNDGKTVRYDGYWHEGTCDGQGKEFRGDGTLIYEGQYRNNQRDGVGLGYYPDGRTVRYDGQWYKGKYTGLGKEFSAYGTLVYEGEYQNGMPHGMGKYYHADGKTVRFEGQWHKGSFLHGKEFRGDATLLYEGQFQSGKHHGVGKDYHTDGKTVVYEGKCFMGRPHGKRNKFRDDGTPIYEKQFDKDKPRNGS